MLFLALLLILLLSVCCNCFVSMQLPLLYAHGLASPSLSLTQTATHSPLHTAKQSTDGHTSQYRHEHRSEEGRGVVCCPLLTVAVVLLLAMSSVLCLPLQGHSIYECLY